MQDGPSELRISPLLNLLSEQLGVYHQLLQLTLGERQAVATSKLDLINEINSEKTFLIQTLREIEVDLKMITSGITSHYKLDSSCFSLTYLASLVTQKTADKISQLQTDLLTVLERLKIENEINENLMMHCISLMDNSINLLNTVTCQNNTYINSGQFVNTQDSGVFFNSKI